MADLALRARLAALGANAIALVDVAAACLFRHSQPEGDVWRLCDVLDAAALWPSRARPGLAIESVGSH